MSLQGGASDEGPDFSARIDARGGATDDDDAELAAAVAEEVWAATTLELGAAPPSEFLKSLPECTMQNEYAANFLCQDLSRAGQRLNQESHLESDRCSSAPPKLSSSTNV